MTQWFIAPCVVQMTSAITFKKTVTATVQSKEGVEITDFQDVNAH